MATVLIERNLIDLKKVLESGVDREVAAVGKAIDAYESCMNTEAIDKAGIQPLRDLIDMTGKKFCHSTFISNISMYKYRHPMLLLSSITTDGTVVDSKKLYSCYTVQQSYLCENT